MFKKLAVLVLMLVATPNFAQEYNSSLTGAQIDSGATAGNNAAAVNGILKGNGAGAFSAAQAGTDYQAPLTAGTNYLRPTTDVDDTPVDGETAQPISSNWAYDHAAAADPHSGYMLESNIGTGANNYIQLAASPGTPDGSRFLRDDRTWAVPSVGYTNLTSFIAQTPWRIFYSNTDGDVVELALGADGEYLKSNGPSAVPSWATPTGAVHDAVTLSTAAGNNLLSLSTQEIGLDNQTANYIFAGPASGGATAPSFRALVSGDIPDLSGTYQPLDAMLTGISALTDPGADRIPYYDDGSPDAWAWKEIGTSAGTIAAGDHNHSGTYEPADATILKQADVDDTPVDGVTTAPVSSNWAYDHAAAADPHSGYMLESNIGTGANNYIQLAASPGTPDGSRFLRDDRTWAVPSVGYTNLTSFIAQTPWRIFYSNTDGDVVELALGADGEYLKSNGASAAPSWATPSGAAHDAVTLSTAAGNNLLSLSTQEIGLDNQTANYIFAGPASGGATAPSFRALVSGDIPDLSGTYQPLDAMLTGISALTDPGADRIPYYDDGSPDAWAWKEIGTSAGTIAAGDHNHSGTYEPADATILKQADVDDTPVDGVTTAPVSSNWAYDHAAVSATESAAGHVELATTAETQTGTDTARAVTPAGVKAVADTKAPVTISRTEFVPVSWMIDGAAAPDAIATVDLGTRQVKARTFASDSSEDVELLWQAPIDIIDGDSGTAGFQVKWRPIYVITASTAPASGEGVTFALAACSSGDSDSGNCTVGDDSVVAYADLDGHAQFDLVYGTYTAMTITDGAAAEAWMMKLYRDHDHASDDYGQMVGLIGIEIKYKATLADSY